MGMFKSDLYRSFLIGFLIGCAGLAATVAGDARAQGNGAVEQAVAAEHTL